MGKFRTLEDFLNWFPGKQVKKEVGPGKFVCLPGCNEAQLEVDSVNGRVTLHDFGGLYGNIKQILKICGLTEDDLLLDGYKEAEKVSELKDQVSNIPAPLKARGMELLSKARSDILARPQSDDLIKDLLPDSASAYMLICGRSGIGKTFLALNLLYCLASGMPFLSHKTKQCKVGYLSMEGSDRKILNRFDILSQSFPGAEEHIYWEHSLAITLNPEGINRLRYIITGLDTVIIDPMRPLIPGDYTTPKDANFFLKNLQILQGETDTKLILIHHIRKPDKRHKVHAEDLMFEVKGAGEYVEAATTVLLLEHAPQPKDSFGRYLQGTDDRLLSFVKVKDAPTDIQPVRLRFDRDKMLFLPLTEDYQIEQ